MITEEIKIPTAGRPVEAFIRYRKPGPDRAFLILPGKGYTINHFLLDFLWKMAAETGFYAIKAEYRGYTYRHLGEPYGLEDAAQDAGSVFDYLTAQGFKSRNIIPCVKSLGTIALAQLLQDREIYLNKSVLLTPVIYNKKGFDTLPTWSVYNDKVKDSLVIFGSADPFCDAGTAAAVFPAGTVKCYDGADHGLDIAGDYRQTIKIQLNIIDKVKEFIS